MRGPVGARVRHLTDKKAAVNSRDGSAWLATSGKGLCRRKELLHLICDALIISEGWRPFAARLLASSLATQLGLARQPPALPDQHWQLLAPVAG